jgi:hypothetical protein
MTGAIILTETFGLADSTQDSYHYLRLYNYGAGKGKYLLLIRNI